MLEHQGWVKKRSNLTETNNCSGSGMGAPPKRTSTPSDQLWTNNLTLAPCSLRARLFSGDALDPGTRKGQIKAHHGSRRSRSAPGAACVTPGAMCLMDVPRVLHSMGKSTPQHRWNVSRSMPRTQVVDQRHLPRPDVSRPAKTALASPKKPQYAAALLNVSAETTTVPFEDVIPSQAFLKSKPCDGQMSAESIHNLELR